jgi:hypothetical protein
VVVSGCVLLEFGGKMNFTGETDLPGRSTAAACGGCRAGEPFL